MRTQIPMILDQKELASGTNVFALSNGSVVIAYRCDLVDAEIADLEDFERTLSEFLKALSPSVLTRVILKSFPKTGLEGTHSRELAIRELAFIEYELCLLFEHTPGPWSEISNLLFRSRADSALSYEGEALERLVPIENLRAHTTINALTVDEFSALLPEALGGVAKTPFGIDLGGKLAGCVRLTKQSVYPINLLTLSILKDAIPAPYRLTVSVLNTSSHFSETLLRRKSRQAEIGEGNVAAHKYHKAQEDLERVAMRGGRILRIEFVVTLERRSEASLREAAEKAARALAPLGETYFETVGAAPTWLATLPGNLPHVSLLEMSDSIACFLPLITRGTAQSKRVVRPRSLLLHRRDDGLGAVDVFDPNNDSFSVNIFGPPGSGKSVLTNMLTRALFSDPSIRITKLDVGGSHSRETETLGGIEFPILLERPTGLNPFSYLKRAPHSPEIVKILATFIETLMREEGELSLSKEIKSDIEAALTSYSESRPIHPSLGHFLENSEGRIPREKLLRRWTGSGVFGNAFKDVPQPERSEESPRLRYYNFSKIAQALDSDFAQGGLAAVMSEFNFEMLFHRNGNRFVFVADEVPVFIQRCFDFFALSIANIRKNGDAFITIAQRSEHVVVGGNMSILDNSPSKFIFAIDGSKETFAQRLHLDDEKTSRIEGLSRIQGKYSEVMHLSPQGAQTYRIELSPEEYWSYTSKKEDKDRLEGIRAAAPQLSLAEVMHLARFLAVWFVLFTSVRSHAIFDFLAKEAKDAATAAAIADATADLFNELDRESPVKKGAEEVRDKTRRTLQEASDVQFLARDTREFLTGPKWADGRLEDNIRATTNFIRQGKNILIKFAALGTEGVTALSAVQTNIALNEIQKNQQALLLQQSEMEARRAHREVQEAKSWTEFIVQQRALRRGSQSNSHGALP